MTNDELRDKLIEVDERVARHGEQIKNSCMRIDMLEENSRKQTDILLALQRQGDAIETMNGKLDIVAENVEEVGSRVAVLEQEPAIKWKKITFEIIKYIALAIVGVIVGYFIKG